MEVWKETIAEKQLTTRPSKEMPKLYKDWPKYSDKEHQATKDPLYDSVTNQQLVIPLLVTLANPL